MMESAPHRAPGVSGERVLPEERVRRGLVAWLQDACGVPARLVAVEFALSRLDPRCRKRADVVVWRPDAAAPGGLRPWLLAECKAPQVKLTQAVADQARGYAARVRAEYVLLTNGADTRVFALRDGGYAPVANVPAYPVDRS